MSIDGKVGINLIKITSFLVLNLKIQYNFCFEPWKLSSQTKLPNRRNKSREREIEREKTRNV